jgi:hypothetical protein
MFKPLHALLWEQWRAARWVLLCVPLTNWVVIRTIWVWTQDTHPGQWANARYFALFFLFLWSFMTLSLLLSAAVLMFNPVKGESVLANLPHRLHRLPLPP